MNLFTFRLRRLSLPLLFISIIALIYSCRKDQYSSAGGGGSASALTSRHIDLAMLQNAYQALRAAGAATSMPRLLQRAGRIRWPA